MANLEYMVFRSYNNGDEYEFNSLLKDGWKVERASQFIPAISDTIYKVDNNRNGYIEYILVRDKEDERINFTKKILKDLRTKIKSQHYYSDPREFETASYYRAKGFEEMKGYTLKEIDIILETIDKEEENK